MRELEERARKSYAGSINLNADEFVQMMLLDGCFIIKLFRKFEMRGLIDMDDPIYQLCLIRNVLRSVENVIVPWNFIDLAIELQEVGVEFKMVNRSSIFDINFTNVVVEIPQL
ncbi:hypothetical protein ACSBR1_031324 [Camellia fascicularis]